MFLQGNTISIKSLIILTEHVNNTIIIIIVWAADRFETEQTIIPTLHYLMIFILKKKKTNKQKPANWIISQLGIFIPFLQQTHWVKTIYHKLYHENSKCTLNLTGVLLSSHCIILKDSIYLETPTVNYYRHWRGTQTDSN